MKKTALILALLLAAPTFAQTTTKPNVSNTLSQCAPNAPVVGNGAGSAPICHPTGALGSAAFVNTGTSGGTLGLLNAANTWSALQTFNSAMLAATAPAFTGTITGTYTLGGTPTIPVSGLTPIGAGVPAALAIAANGAGGFPTYTAGSWTPTLTTTGTVGTPTYTIQVGTYEQIGRQVTVRFSLTITAWAGSPTGNVSIASLPLTSANITNDNGTCTMGSYVVTGLTASNILSGVVNANTSTIQMLQIGNTTGAVVTAAQFGPTAVVIGMCGYHT